jgi:hypothetical protein
MRPSHRHRRDACAGQLDLVQKPVEPFAGQPGRLVEPFACVNIVVLDRQHHEFLRFASPLVEFFVVPIQNLNPDVLMVEPAEDWYRCDAAELLRPPKIRSVFIQ